MPFVSFSCQLGLLVLFQNGYFSLPSGGSTRKFFSHCHYGNMVELLCLKPTKMCTLYPKSGPLGIFKPQASLHLVSINSSIAIAVTGSSSFCFQLAHLSCDFLYSPPSRFLGGAGCGSSPCHLNSLRSLRKVIGF